MKKAFAVLLAHLWLCYGAQAETYRLTWEMEDRLRTHNTVIELWHTPDFTQWTLIPNISATNRYWDVPDFGSAQWFKARPVTDTIEGEWLHLTLTKNVRFSP